MILLLLGSAFVSIVLGQYDDAISISISVVIVVSVAFVQEYRSEQSIQELSRLMPHTSRVVRDGTENEELSSSLVVGDIIILSIGDRVPADCRLLESTCLQIDESSLTGENEPCSKDAAATVDVEEATHSLAERRNIVFMGTLVCTGNARAIVVATGARTEFGSIFAMMEEVEDVRTPLQNRMDALSKQLTIFSFVIIGFIAFVGYLKGKHIMKIFNISVSLAVAAIPEGLPICVTVTLALGVIRMSKRDCIVKKLPAVEALGCANVVCVDKTGTLTKAEMTVVELYSPFNAATTTVSGVGYNLFGSFDLPSGEPITVHSHPHVVKLLEAGSLCNNASFQSGGKGKMLGSPTEGALLCAALKFGLVDPRATTGRQRVKEIPFSSETKWMAVQCLNPKGSKAGSGETLWYVKGSIDVVLGMCSHMCTDTSHLQALSQTDVQRALQSGSAMAHRGLRVIALAYGASMDDNKLVFAGLAAIFDPPRDGIAGSIECLQSTSVSVVMITGDSQETAEAVGTKIGIFQPGRHTSLSGNEVDSLSPGELQALVSQTTVFYRTTPKHKLNIVRAYQANENIVAMTGDGVNDAPALRAADIGIAMGKSGTDVAREAADIVLVNDNFVTILTAMEEGKGIFHNIRNFLRFQLSTSIAALGLITLCTTLGLPNPLNAMQILWINIIMDGPPAQSLGVEPVDPDVLHKPPRKKDENILDKELLTNVVLTAIHIVLGTMWVFKNELEDGKVSDRDRTMSFTTFVMFDMFNSLSCRNQQKSIFQVGFFTNFNYLVAVGASLLGQVLVIYAPPLQVHMYIYIYIYIFSLSLSLYTHTHIDTCIHFVSV
jgi:Ca2+-transporting ATPase